MTQKNLLAGSSSLYEFVVFKNLSNEYVSEIKTLNDFLN